MKKANVIHGRIEEHGEGLGTSDEDLVRKRAREIAVTNGRRAEEVDQRDLDQARQELEMAQRSTQHRGGRGRGSVYAARGPDGRFFWSRRPD